MSRNRKAALLGVTAAVAAAAFLLPRARPAEYHGTFLGPGPDAADFTLHAGDRGPVSLSDFRGRAVLLFFGYTTCPDVCPLTLDKLRRALDALGPGRRGDVQVLFVSIDPDVDTPDAVRDYVRQFDPAFLGLTGDRPTLAGITRSFGIHVGEPQAAAPGPGQDPHAGHGPAGHRLVPHTTHVLGLDRAGRLRLLWGPDLTAEQIGRDLRALVRL